MKILDFTEKIVDLKPIGLKFLRQAKIQYFPLPDGGEGQWHSLYSQNPVGVLMAGLAENGLILVSLFRPPTERNGIIEKVFELPGGAVDENEDPAKAAKREFLAETGYRGKSFEKLCAGWAYNSKSNMRFEIYLTCDCVKIQMPELDPVEQAMGLEVIKKDPAEIMQEISQGSMAYDPPISHALIAMLGRRIIKL